MIEVELFFELAGLHGMQAYSISTSDAQTALIYACTGFGRDVLIACMGEGLQVLPRDVVLTRVNLRF